MGIFLFLGFGAWCLYHAWRGVMPNAKPVLWGKDESGQKMGLRQRLVFGMGGVLLFGLGMILWQYKNSK
jgi:hypothetical protein